MTQCMSLVSYTNFVFTIFAPQACEQLFSWLSGYKSIVRHMNEARFIIFITRMCHLHNCALEREMSAKGLLVSSGANADVTVEVPSQEINIKSSPLFMDAVRFSSISYIVHMMNSTSHMLQMCR